MREAVWLIGWDVFLLAVPLLGILLIGFSRLHRLVSTIKMERKAACAAFECAVWDVDAEVRPLLWRMGVYSPHLTADNQMDCSRRTEEI